jgi:hypothetical protein
MATVVTLSQLSKALALKPEPQLTPALKQIIARENARSTVSDYLFTPSLRAHAKRIFECAVHGKGQGFWVQAEYGAGKTSFLGTILCLLMWGPDEKVWEVLRDKELRDEYEHAISKVRLFPVAFSLKGLGDTQGAQFDSLMRIFEEQIAESLLEHAPELAKKVRITSAELAIEWLDKQAPGHLKAGLDAYLQEHHQLDTSKFRAKHGDKKLGQEIVAARIAEGQLKAKYKERFIHICQQIMKLGDYSGLAFVVDEFRSWQDRHAEHSSVAGEDEDVLETLAHVLPGEGINVLTIVASQGSIPQKLSGGGKGDRFIPLLLLSDKNQNDFGEIVAFRTAEHLPGASTIIKDFFSECRDNYRFLKQANISIPQFSAIFPFQPRVFEILRRITQSYEANNLPTARSAIRMAWQAISDGNLLNNKRLVVVADLIQSDEMRKGLNSEVYREKFQNLQAAVEQLAEFGLAPEEREQARRILETLFLQAISVPENIRDGLTAEEVAEAAWLLDLDVGATGQAEHLLDVLISGGSPIRRDRKTKGGSEVAVFSYETAALKQNPATIFGPLKKKFKDDPSAQDAKWLESLFWDLTVVTPEIQQELQLNGGMFSEFQPDDQRKQEEIKAGQPARYVLPKAIAASTRRVHNIHYSGEVIVSDRWRDEWAKALDQPDVHFRVVYLTTDGTAKDVDVTKALADPRIVVCHPKKLSADTREALADVLAAEKMRRDYAQSPSLRAHAEEKRAEGIKAVLKQQLLEFRTGRVLTKADYGIPAADVFSSPAQKSEDLARRLLEKAYDKPLFSPTEIKKPFSDTEARKVFTGLFTKEAQKADRDALTNYGPGLELSRKSSPQEFRADDSQALKRIRDSVNGKTDIPVKELKAQLCAPPYALTDSMVQLYLFALLKQGGWELMLNPMTPAALSTGQPLPGNKLTANTVGLVDWNAKLDKSLLGARLIFSTQKGWNDVLPYARVLDPSLKTAGPPDEQEERNKELMKLLSSLNAELPQLEASLDQLAVGLSGEVPADIKATVARFKALAVAADFREFDATVRVSYDASAKFQAAFEEYGKARQVRDRALELNQARGYLSTACNLDSALEIARTTLIGQLKLELLLTQPHVIGARLDAFNKWKDDYVQAYRKRHRAHYENLAALKKSADTLRPRAIALNRLNTISELGPPVGGTSNITADFESFAGVLWPCPISVEADVHGANATCSKCGWTPAKALPQPEHDRLDQAVSQGLDDRLLRLKDASIATVLKNAAGGSKGAELKGLLEIIQLANADKLVGVMTDELADFLRQLLQEANIVQESVPLAPLLEQIGAIEEDRVEEAVSKLSGLLRNAIKDAKAKHGAGKRVRVFLRVNDEPRA